MDILTNSGIGSAVLRTSFVQKYSIYAASVCLSFAFDVSQLLSPQNMIPMKHAQLVTEDVQALSQMYAFIGYTSGQLESMV